MKNKKWLLILIIAFPSFFWLILESSTINSRKLPFYGPKKVIAQSDTTYYKVSDQFYQIDDNSGLVSASAEPVPYPVYAVIFIDKKYRLDSYRLTGLWEYLNYKKQKIEHIPFVLVTESDSGRSGTRDELKKLSGSKNIHFYGFPFDDFGALAKSYFEEKPYYIDYSFFLLIDQDRHIRGYYDGRYVSELKRLIEEYQHLRLKEAKQKLTESNEIKSNT
ncbi:MAG TPA: hypothetical protein PL029_02915 [Bacteroidia bacterium]|nr:hypothetical protein [Bacteroidia bacterium]